MITRKKLLEAVRRELKGQNQIKEEEGPKEVHIDQLRELLDEEFIEKAFLTLLNRKPKEDEKEYFLSRLRTGELTKEEIIVSLRFSEEGEKVGVNVVGLKKFSLIKRISDLLPGKRLSRWLKGFIYTLRLVNVISAQERKLLEQERKLSEETQKLKEELNTLRELIERKLLPSTELIDFTDEEYAEFEERFRGKREEVKENFKVYIPLIRQLKNRFEDEEIRAVDLGCGRGEWLEVLKEEGINGVGVDLNEVFLSYLKSVGLKGIKKDVVEYLKSLESDKLHLITAFHLIEHINIKRRIEFIKEAFRVLKRGGVLIVETPNPRNILVGSGDFYRDPSHVTPLFPDTLSFIGKMVGFSVSKAYFFKGSELVDVETVRFDTLEDYVNISRDFAWIAIK